MAVLGRKAAVNELDAECGRLPAILSRMTNMKRLLRGAFIVASFLGVPSAFSQPVGPLIIPATFLLTNGWEITCYGLEQKNTSCMAEHRDAAPFLYIQAWPDRINVAVSENCTRDGYTPAEAVGRRKKTMPQLIKEIDDQLIRRAKACLNDPMRGDFRSEVDDVIALLIRTTAQ
jgi:hypothetical protein